MRYDCNEHQYQSDYVPCRYCNPRDADPPPPATRSPITICAECKWFQNESICWHEQYCGHPRREKKEVIDFVTGKRGFGGTNDLGRVYLTDEKRPNAREINNDGMCETFEENS